MIVASLLATGVVYGISESMISTSAEHMLSMLVEIGTYEAASDHKKKNGDLPRQLWNGIDGTRSQQYTTVKHLPSPYAARIFSGWRCWKNEGEEGGGGLRYVFAFVPIGNYSGSIESPHSKGVST